MCSATSDPVAEGPTYTRREIDYPAIVPSLAVTGCSSIKFEPEGIHHCPFWSSHPLTSPRQFDIVQIAALAVTECNSIN
jgi:hypothetical protein